MKRNNFHISFEEKMSFLRSVFKERPGERFYISQLTGYVGNTDKKSKGEVKRIIDILLKEEYIVKEGRFYTISKKQLPSQEGIVISTNYMTVYVKCDNYKRDVACAVFGLEQKLIIGDTVRIYVNPHSSYDRPNGEIIEIVKRSDKVYTGVVSSVSERNIIVVPGSPKLPRRICVPAKESGNVKENDKVGFRIIDWKESDAMPTASITMNYGEAGEHENEIHAIIDEFALPTKFPEEVMAESEAIPEEIDKEEYKNRRDFRDIVTFTIDPKDAKDFDDALSIRKLDNNLWEVGIHIADVTYYVRPGSAIEEEAIYRGTSVYLVDRTLPMLPERLSNKLCSLRPDEEKLCYSAVFTMDTDGNIKDEWFGRTIIRSNRRFTYEEAQSVIETKEGDLKEEILTLHSIAQRLREERFEKGSVSFERKEVKFNLDEKNHPVSIYFKEQKEANQLIEEFMLLANRRVAQFCAKEKGRNRTMVFRVHDKPSMDKIQAFSHVASSLGHHANFGKGVQAQKLNSLIASLKGLPEEEILSSMAIRAMAKACYTTKNIGHYGLGFEYYTHFTSPIRRYPDMMVHRILDRYLNNKKEPDIRATEELCLHSSDRENVAADAERASIKYKMVEFMQGKENTHLSGYISGFSSSAIYVQLDNTPVEGMLPLSDIHFDHFYYDRSSLTVEASYYEDLCFRIGEKIDVVIRKVDINARTIFLVLDDMFIEQLKKQYDYPKRRR